MGDFGPEKQMSWTCKYAGGLVEMTVDGLFTGDDLAQLEREIGRIEAEAPVTPHRLADMSAVTGVSIGISDMDSFAARRTAAKLRNRVKSGIVATAPVQYGFARMFLSLMSNPMITVSVFRERESALKWLGEDSA
jgi:hypothetical protein